MIHTPWVTISVVNSVAPPICTTQHNGTACITFGPRSQTHWPNMRAQHFWRVHQEKKCLDSSELLLALEKTIPRWKILLQRNQPRRNREVIKSSNRTSTKYKRTSRNCYTDTCRASAVPVDTVQMRRPNVVTLSFHSHKIYRVQKSRINVPHFVASSEVIPPNRQNIQTDQAEWCDPTDSL